MRTRIDKRYRPSHTIYCNISRGKLSFIGRVINISKEGISFISRVSNPKILKKGRKFEIEFRLDGIKFEGIIEIRYFNAETGICGCSMLSLIRYKKEF